jgi:hypothetical protein
MLDNLRASALTFKKCTVEKLALIILNLIDLSLTLFAVSQVGAHEINPLMRSMYSSPYQMYLTKLVMPTFFAWALPGKLLIPAIAALTFIVGWDIKELVVYFF